MGERKPTLENSLMTLQHGILASGSSCFPFPVSYLHSFEHGCSSPEAARLLSEGELWAQMGAPDPLCDSPPQLRDRGSRPSGLQGDVMGWQMWHGWRNGQAQSESRARPW